VGNAHRQYSMMFRTLLGLAAALLLALPSLVLPDSALAGETRRLAVLELRGDFPRPELSVLSDQLRQGALAALRGTGYEVMTRENMAMLARSMGIDLEACQEGAECEVDIGRNVGADVVLSGGVVSFGSKLTVTLKLHDTVKGSLLASSTTRAANKDELIDVLPPAAEALIREGLYAARSAATVPGKRVEGGSFQAQDRGLSEFGGGTRMVVAFESTPRGAVVYVDGQLTCQATPCSREIMAGSHQLEMQKERYHPTRKTFQTRRGEKVGLTLNPMFGRILVDTSPPGLSLSINGDTKLTSPVSVERNPGAYTVAVDDPCYLPDGERFQLEEGDEKVIAITGRLRLAGLDLRAVDEQGNALEGLVYVDGQRLGHTPGRFELGVCARELRVLHGKGIVAVRELALREGEWAFLEAILPRRGEGRIVEAAQQRLNRGLEAVRRSIQKSNCTAAVTNARSLTAAHPKDPAPWFILGQALACAGDWLGALGAYEGFGAAGGSANKVRAARKKIRKQLASIQLGLAGVQKERVAAWAKTEVKVRAVAGGSEVAFSRAADGTFRSGLLVPGAYEIEVTPPPGYFAGRRSQSLVAGQHVVLESQLAEDCDHSLKLARAAVQETPNAPEPHLEIASALRCAKQWSEAWRSYDTYLSLGGEPSLGKGELAALAPHVASLEITVASSDPAHPVPADKAELLLGPSKYFGSITRTGPGKLLALGITPGAVTFQVSAGPEFEPLSVDWNALAGKQHKTTVTLRHYEKAFFSVGPLDPALVLDLQPASGDQVYLVAGTRFEVSPGEAVLRATLGGKSAQYSVQYNLQLDHGLNELSLPWGYTVHVARAYGNQHLLTAGLLEPGAGSAQLQVILPLQHGDLPPVKVATTIEASPGLVQRLILDPSRHPLVTSWDAVEEARKTQRVLTASSISSAGAGVAGIVLGVVQLALAANASDQAGMTEEQDAFTELTGQVRDHRIAGALGLGFGGTLSSLGLILGLGPRQANSKILAARRAEHKRLIEAKDADDLWLSLERL